MGYLSHRVDPKEIKPGDHLYTWRAQFLYSHHGIYVGEKKVVHFTCQKNASSGSISSSSINPYSDQNVVASCLTPDCGFQKQGRSGVILSCLNCFIGSGSLYLFQYGLNPIVSISKLRSGTCTVAKSDPPQQVIHRAMYLFQNGYGNYHLFENNCEDFALYCKTGFLVCGNSTGRSGQGDNFKGNTMITTGLGAQATMAIAAVPVFPEVAIPYLFVLSVVSLVAKFGVRYNTDIGIRRDAIKVDVEDFVFVS